MGSRKSPSRKILLKITDMSEKDRIKLEELSHLEQMDQIIAKRMKPFYWIFSVALAFGTVLSTGLIETVRNQGTYIKSEEAYRNFLDKPFFHQLQKAEHTADVEAIQNPSNAANVYARHNQDEAEKLELKYRGNEK